MKRLPIESASSPAAQKWQRVQEIFAEQQEHNRKKLLEEASYLGLVDGYSQINLVPSPHRFEPKVALALLSQAAPELNLSELDQANPYDVAVALLKMYAADQPEKWGTASVSHPAYLAEQEAKNRIASQRTDKINSLPASG